MSKHLVTVEEVLNARRDYYSGRGQELRLGQYLMNKLLKDTGVSDSEIFYEVDDDAAFQKFYKRFVCGE
jgi:hypothetical protein